MMGITSVWICNGQITRTVTTEDSVLIARYPRSVSTSKYSMSGIYRGVRTRVYPGRQGRPIWAASTLRATGMGSGGSGDLAGPWVGSQYGFI